MESPQKGIILTPRKRKRKELTIGEKSLPYYEEPEVKSQDLKKNYYICKTCHRAVNGTNLYNLGSHLSNIHPEIFVKIAANQKDSMPVKRLKIIHNSIEIVTVNGRPFSWLLDSGYQKGIMNKLQKLREAGYGINFSKLNEIKEHLNVMAVKVRDKIRDEVSGQKLCVMADIGSKNNRSIFGISIQYIIDGELHIRSVSMIELLKSHTGNHLAQVMIQCLSGFGIGLDQVIAITTDNGANVLKMIRDIDSSLHNVADEIGEQTRSEATNGSTNNPNQNEELIDDEIDGALAENDELTDEEALDILFEETTFKHNETLLTALSTEIVTNGADIHWNISGVNCTAHTLQLAIKDALKKLPRRQRNVIELCRRVAKFLRLTSTRHIIDELKLHCKLIRLDCDTRWCATYMMVRCFF